MGYLKYVRALWKNPRENLGELYRQRITQWRNEPVTVRLEHPTRLDRAHSLGYKAKQGFIIARQRVNRGGRQKPRPAGGRKSKRMSRRKILKITYQLVAEQRAAKKYPNCEVLNSYWVGKDRPYYFF